MVTVRDKRSVNLPLLPRGFFDLSSELNEAVEITAMDIQRGIEKGGQFGIAFKRNAPSTIAKKGFDHPLKETGLMMDSGKMTKVKAKKGVPGAGQQAKLGPNRKRWDVAAYNDEGTDDIPARPFWGVSNAAEKTILKMVMDSIDRRLRNAGI